MKETHVIYVLDASWSMNKIKGAALSGFNENLEATKEGAKAEPTFVSLYVFSDPEKVREVAFCLPAEEIKGLTNETYVCDGNTALCDAVGLAIERMEQKIKERSELHHDLDWSVLLNIITDGEENRSRKFRKMDIAEKVRSVEGTGRWTVTYLGDARVDLTKIQEDYGIRAGNMRGAVMDSMVGATKGLAANSAGTRAFYAARSAGAAQVANYYQTSDPEEELNADDDISIQNTTTSTGETVGESTSSTDDAEEVKVETTS